MAGSEREDDHPRRFCERSIGVRKKLYIGLAIVITMVAIFGFFARGKKAERLSPEARAMLL